MRRADAGRDACTVLLAFLAAISGAEADVGRGRLVGAKAGSDTLDCTAGRAVDGRGPRGPRGGAHKGARPGSMLERGCDGARACVSGSVECTWRKLRPSQEILGWDVGGPVDVDTLDDAVGDSPVMAVRPRSRKSSAADGLLQTPASASLSGGTACRRAPAAALMHVAASSAPCTPAARAPPESSSRMSADPRSPSVPGGCRRTSARRAAACRIVAAAAGYRG